MIFFFACCAQGRGLLIEKLMENRVMIDDDSCSARPPASIQAGGMAKVSWREPRHRPLPAARNCRSGLIVPDLEPDKDFWKSSEKRVGITVANSVVPREGDPAFPEQH